MSVTYSAVSISTITEIQDYLANHGAQVIDPWRLEVRLYRANQETFGPEGKSKSLFTIWASHYAQSLWSFSPENTGICTSTAMRSILETKLQGMWTLRQTFKGEGFSFKLDDGSHIRLCNVLVQGNYKGLFVDADPSSDCQNLFNKMVEGFSLVKPEEPVTEDSQKRARMYQKVYR